MDTVVSVQNLTKRYGSITAVDNISFEVNHGEIFGFLGPNGAGKTTTQRVLTGLTKPTSGKVEVAGYDITKETVKAKASMGIVPEVSNVYDEMSAWDNLIFASQLHDVPRNNRQNRAKELLELFGLFERRLDHVGTYSRGMKRRLTIAAALVAEPRILFLDEPTTGLDVQSSRLIRSYIKDLNKNGTTIFLTTHYIEEADQLCQRVAIINHAKIVTIASPEKLKTSAEKHQIIEVSFNKIDNLESRLSSLSGVRKIFLSGDKFMLHVDNTSEGIVTLVDFAKDNGLVIMSLNTLKPTLEDAFVELTGISSETLTREKEEKKGAAVG
jgi:ABC-2 type transport system ATP-binding protein